MRRRALESYDWPGNVRELQNVIERAVILSRDGRIQFELPHRPGPIRGAGPRSAAGLATDGDDGELSLDELAIRERQIVATALERRNWKIYGSDGAAALLKVKPTTLVSMIKRLNLQRPAQS